MLVSESQVKCCTQFQACLCLTFFRLLHTAMHVTAMLIYDSRIQRCSSSHHL